MLKGAGGLEMTLSEVVADISQNKKTGILSIAIRGDAKNLFKVFFKEGTIYHLTCGNQKDSECLNYYDTFDFSSCSFLANAKSDVPHAVGLPATPEIVKLFQSKNIPIEIIHPDGKSASTGGVDAIAPADYERIKEELKVALIKQIGPAGGKILTKIISEKWRVLSPAKEDLQRLVALLKNEIEDDANKDQFTQDAERILS